MYPKDLSYRIVRRAKRDFVIFSKGFLDLLNIKELPIIFRSYRFLWNKLACFRKLKWKHELREIADYLQLDNPLRSSPVQDISVGILCHPKDLKLLRLCIEGAIANIEDNLSQIFIVSPQEIDFQNFNYGIPIVNLLDSDLVDEVLLEKLKSKFGSVQFTWILQQVLKIRLALKLDVSRVLILDSDTVLTSPRKFTDESVQILSISYEYHSHYVNHYKKFKPTHQELGVSFVTHHQLWQRDIAAAIWGGKGLDRWLESADTTHPNSISEYHTYGTFLINEFPGRFIWARWGNKPVSKQNFILHERLTLDRATMVKGRPNSISVHDYS